MMSEVALSAAMRSNLLTLQSTQKNMDGIQFRLSTGRKVNSALDNPQSFFAAQALSNRAADLARLLDGMGQSISTIQQADKGASALTKMVQQADAIANQALTASAAGSQVAKLTGTTSLTKSQVVTDLSGVNAGAALTFQLTNEDGVDVTPAGPNDSVTIAAGETVEQMLANINAITYGSDNKQALQARLDENGKLEIQSLTGGNLRVVFNNAGGGDDLDVAKALGFGDRAAVQGTAVNATDEVALTALAKPALMSTSFRTGSGNDIAVASSNLMDLVNASGDNLFEGTGGATDGDSTARLQLSINGTGTINLATFNINKDGLNTTVTTDQTIQGLVDTINTSSLSSFVEASYDTATGSFSIRAVSAAVQTVQFGVQAEGAAAGVDADFTANLGFGTGDMQAIAAGGVSPQTTTNTQSFILGAAAGELANLERDFNAIRTQIDQLVKDTGYQGINLLNGDNLTTAFNADRTSSITTRGVVFNSAGLGIKAANFGTGAAINTALAELRQALTEVRRFGSSLANDLSVIQTRQDFTQTTIQTLTEGADKLTLADQNEEGAKMLALQVRQQLGVVSLSLASQAQQSVLRLF
ncbi:MAG: flagellin [Rhodospirillales bacterium]|nr:MAG: flagellin [Rhodospirillales bacterium]